MQIGNKNKCTPIIGPAFEKIYELIGAETMSKDVSVAYLELPKGASTSKHYHPTMVEIYYVLEGNAQLLIDDELKAISKNDIIYIKKNSIHHLKNHSCDVLHLLTISIPAWTPQSEIIID